MDWVKRSCWIMCGVMFTLSVDGFLRGENLFWMFSLVLVVVNAYMGLVLERWR